MGPCRTLEPAWRFWAKELLFFGAGMTIGWWLRQWQLRTLGSEVRADLTPEERARLEASDELP